MTIFYLISALLCMILILCNQHFSDKAEKLTGSKLVMGIALSVVPVVNTLFILGVFYLAFKAAAQEVGGEQ